MLFGKGAAAEYERLAGGILDNLEQEIIITRGADCQVLYANGAAKAHMEQESMDPQSCRAGFGGSFLHLCAKCPGDGFDGPNQPITIKDDKGRWFSIQAGEIQWMDSKPAVMLQLRNVDQELQTKQKLYGLAYLDQLTGVPNRTKLKEEYAKIQDDADAVGAVALFDMDNFKAINDTYGHNTGDIMLRRLTEHLQKMSAFKGHLYRLGGDEFVLLYTYRKGELNLPDEAAYREYFGSLLRGAFYSYTMPNIELSCTISMGVSFIPLHGAGFSELLRKADIALYEAKEAGRNRLVFFEDKYDAAKKFADYYINIQPVLSNGEKTYGYELNDSADQQDGKNLNLGDYDRAIEALGLRDLENDVKYFINYSAQLSTKAVLNNLPRDKFIIQVALPPTLSDEILEVYGTLYAFGYTLALSGLREENCAPELMGLAEYCRFAPQVPEAVQKQIMAQYPEKSFIATGINSNAAYQAAKAKGFALFQGTFFSQQVVVKKEKDISPLRANYLRLLKLTSTDDYVDFSQIADIISTDVALSYKLLRLLNSAAVGLRNRISSISMAVSYLGEESLKKWIALLALRGAASDKPLELIRMSLVRAQFGELLAPHMRPRRDPKRVFLVGMFSLLHIALDKTKEELFAEIPMADDIRDSLMSEDGVYSDLIPFFSQYEYANWEEVSRFAEKNGLSSELIYNAYIAAVKWYNDLTNE